MRVVKLEPMDLASDERPVRFVEIQQGRYLSVLALLDIFFNEIA